MIRASRRLHLFGWDGVATAQPKQGGRWPGPPGLTHRAAVLIAMGHVRLFSESMA